MHWPATTLVCSHSMQLPRIKNNIPENAPVGTIKFHVNRLCSGAFVIAIAFVNLSFTDKVASSPGQRCNAWQLTPFQPLKKGAAGRGDVGEVIRDASRVERGHGVTAASDGRKPACPGEIGGGLG